MRNVRALRDGQRDAQNPGCQIGEFLLTHTNSLPYLVDQLEAYLAAARADLEAERSMFRSLVRPPVPPVQSEPAL